MGIGKPDAERLAKQVHEESISKGRYPVGHPLAWLEEEAQPNLSEDRRQEIIRLGFPDDGYDYLQHMRRGQGSSVTFVTQQKPEEITPDGSATGLLLSHTPPLYNCCSSPMCRLALASCLASTSTSLYLELRQQILLKHQNSPLGTVTPCGTGNHESGDLI